MEWGPVLILLRHFGHLCPHMFFFESGLSGHCGGWQTFEVKMSEVGRGPPEPDTHILLYER